MLEHGWLLYMYHFVCVGGVCTRNTHFQVIYAYILLVAECMAFLASGSERTMTVFARAILAYLQLAPWNHEDWKKEKVQSKPVTKECSECRRMDDISPVG